jgi:biopolymer transport protein ExbB
VQHLGFLKALALYGGDWVLYFLLVCSVVSVAIIMERAIYFFCQRGRDTKIVEQVLASIECHDLISALAHARDGRTPIARMLLAGLCKIQSGAGSVERMMANQILTERIAYERYLVVLGTLGNNAPFIGLFGTVLGIIKAFNDLAISGQAGPKIVMAGISEALIATAVGLLVAIPAVIAYNFFQRLIKTAMVRLENTSRLVLSAIESNAVKLQPEVEEMPHASP